MNQTNADGLGIASVKKTAFEITAQPLFPEGANEADYVTVICDAGGPILVSLSACLQYMNELKGSPEKIAKGALFHAEITF